MSDGPFKPEAAQLQSGRWVVYAKEGVVGFGNTPNDALKAFHQALDTHNGFSANNTSPTPNDWAEYNKKYAPKETDD